MTVFETAEFLRAHDNYLILTHTRPDEPAHIECRAFFRAALQVLGNA